MVVVVIFSLLILCVCNCIIAKKFEDIAFDKGYGVEGVHAFAMVFWFGIVGILYVIALPPIKSTSIKSISTKPTPIKPNEHFGGILQNHKEHSNSPDKTDCPFCLARINRTETVCPKCGSKLR